MSNATMNVYVASLSDYNAGHLTGAWIDCIDKSVDDVYAEIQAVLATSVEPVAEEWAIHDYECPIRLNEYVSIEDIVRIAQLLNEHDEQIVQAACATYSNNIDDIESLLDNGYSVYADKDEVIDSWLECMDVPQSVQSYINTDAVWRDLQIDGTYHVCDDGTIVEFHS